MSNISVSFSRHPTSSGASDASRNQMKVSPLIRFRSGDSLDVLSLSLSSSCCVFYTASGGCCCCGQHTRVRIRPEYIPTLTFLSIFTHVSKTERKREKRKKDVTIMNHLWKQKEKKKKKRGREGSSHPLHLVGGFPVADETETKTCVYAS